MDHPEFFWYYSSNDYICIFFKRNKTRFILPFPIKQFFYIYFCSIQTYFNFPNNTEDGQDLWKRRGKFEREIEDSVFVKKKKCRLLFFELDILGLNETFILIQALHGALTTSLSYSYVGAALNNNAYFHILCLTPYQHLFIIRTLSSSRFPSSGFLCFFFLCVCVCVCFIFFYRPSMGGQKI